MLVYGHRTIALNVRDFARSFTCRVRDLPNRPSHGTLVDLLVDIGEAEAAVADALAPREDDLHESFTAWNRTCASLADAVCASARGDDVEGPIARLRAAVAALDRPDWPVAADGKTAEGFAHYALFPDQYIEAVELLLAEMRPSSALFLGLRSIGSILAHVAAAAARRLGVDATAVSVRPRGHPFDRRITLGRRLRASLERSPVSIFGVVDEGPGLSGSSFAAGSEALIACGIEPSRIFLLPAWEAKAEALVSDRGRSAWTRHRHFVAAFTPSWTAELPDVSAGRWRANLMSDPSTWPAVQPQHERRKYLAGATAPKEIFRFAGLGRYGRAKYARAVALAEAGFGPRPTKLTDGFLGLAWMPGSPLHGKAATPSLVRRLAEYAAFVRTLETGESENVAEVAEAAVCNARDALGDRGAEAMSLLGRDAAAFTEPRVAVDGRLLPHEWIEDAGTWFKADALDHHADDFLPGCRDIAWDLAGAIVEFGLPAGAEHLLLAQYSRLARDGTIGKRLPFYCAAYLSYRFAYASLCGRTLGGTADGSRFTLLARRYRRSLAERLQHRPRDRRR